MKPIDPNVLRDMVLESRKTKVASYRRWEVPSMNATVDLIVVTHDDEEPEMIHIPLPKYKP